MSSWAIEALGPQLLTKEGLKATADVLNGKSRVALYFSAHWVRKIHQATFVGIKKFEFFSVSSLQRFHSRAC